MAEKELSMNYEQLLKKFTVEISNIERKPKQNRLELPTPEIQWIGRKTVFRNFNQFPPLLRREKNSVLIYLAKELATAASMDGNRAIFIGRKDKMSFGVLLERYFKQTVECPVCMSPDTKLDKVKRLQFLICEACGARSSIGSR